MVVAKRKALSAVQNDKNTSSSSNTKIKASAGVLVDKRANKLEQWRRDKLQNRENEKSNDTIENLNAKLKEWKKKALAAEARRQALQERLKTLCPKSEDVDINVQADSSFSVPSVKSVQTDVDETEQKNLLKQQKDEELIKSLQQQVKTQNADSVRLQNTVFEANNYCKTLQSALQKAIDANEKLEAQIASLTSENSAISSQRSQLIEFSVLMKIENLEQKELKKEVNTLQRALAKAYRRAKRNTITLPRIPKLASDDADIMQAEASALKHEVAVCRSAAKASAAQSATLAFGNGLLQQQVADVYQTARETVLQINKQNESESAEGQQEMADFVATMQEQMNTGLEKSAAKIKESRKKILHLTRENQSLVAQLAQFTSPSGVEDEK